MVVLKGVFRMIDYTDLKFNTSAISTKDISDAIRHLTEKFNFNYDDIVSEVYTECNSTYDIPSVDNIGSATIRGLYKIKDVAVAKVTIKSGTSIEAHVHDEVEIIKVLSGCIKLYVGEDGLKEYILNPDQLFVIDKNVNHFTVAVGEVGLEYSEVLCITLPASKTYPISGE